MDLNRPIVSESYKTDRRKFLIEYFCMNLHRQNFNAYRFFCCEVLNFVNVIGQIFLMDFFLNGEFRTYGLDVLRFTKMEPEDRIDPISQIFPKLTKCTYHKYGASGTPQKFDGL